MTTLSKKTAKKSNVGKRTQNYVPPTSLIATDDTKGGKMARPGMAFLYDKITQTIISQLEKGVIPWKAQYKKNGYGFPQNYCSKRPYTSINMLLLALLPYEKPYYLTLKQINQLGGRVRKGEKGHIVTFWKFPNEDKKAALLAEGKSAAPLFRFYYVWNIDQTDGIDVKLPDLDALVETNRQLQINELQEIVDRMSRDGIQISHTCPGTPCYLPRRDSIVLPTISEFRTPENYYKTMFHELVHATGHPKRLNRESIAAYVANREPNALAYAFEELIAELGTSFLLNALGVDFSERDDLLENAAAYIDHYSKLLSSDRTIIVKAASKAQAAAEYILDQRSLPDDEE